MDKKSVLKPVRVRKLPVLDPTVLPKLPRNFAGQFYYIFGGKWHHREEENAVGLLITIAAQHGKWKPIRWEEITKIVKSNSWIVFAWDYTLDEAFINLVKAGDIKLLRLGKNQVYIVPTAKLVKSLANSVWEPWSLTQ